MNKALLALALMAGLLFSLNPAQALTIGADGLRFSLNPAQAPTIGADGLRFSLNPAQAPTIGADGISPSPEVKSEKGLRVAFNPITERGFPLGALNPGTDKGSLQGIRMKAASSPVHAAPLPGAILLMTAGLLRVVAYARRRRLDEVEPS